MAQSDQLMRMGFARITIRTICRRCFAMRRGGFFQTGGVHPGRGRTRGHTLRRRTVFQIPCGDNADIPPYGRS